MKDSLAEVNILLLLKRKNKTLKSDYLERRFGIDGQQVRRCVHNLRLAGEPIGSSRHGYYYCNRKEGLNETISHIEGRINSLEKVKTALIKTRERIA